MKIAVVLDPHLQERTPRSRRDDFLSTALKKLKYVSDNNDYVIVAGDLLNSHSNSPQFFNTLYNFFTSCKSKFIVVLGNHDILSRNYNAINRTTIGSLHITGALEIKTEAFELGGVKFGVSLVDKDINKIPIDENNENILIAHNYYEMTTCPEESLTREDLKKLNYKYVLCGHDHSPYEEMFIENSMLFRCGSLTRIDTQMYNKDRKIYYYQYCTEDEEFTLKEIPSLPSNDVYAENSFVKKAYKTDTSFLKISDIVEKFTRNSKGSFSLLEKLILIKTPQRQINKIKYLHELNGVNFS
jgi:DNA repair exonuclease SbcCD nuclease subunit